MQREDIGRVDEKRGTEVFAFGITGYLAQIGLQFLLARAPGEVRIGLAEAELSERLHDLGAGKGLRQENNVRIDGLNFPDQPFPERKWLGVRIVDPKDAHPLRDPEQHDVAQGVPKSFAVGHGEIRVDYVLVLLGWVLSISDRAVGPAPEPVRMLNKPGVVGRALDREVQRDLQSVRAAGSHQALEIIERPQVGMDRIVAALSRADSVEAAGIPGLTAERIIATLAVRTADRIDRRSEERSVGKESRD